MYFIYIHTYIHTYVHIIKYTYIHLYNDNRVRLFSLSDFSMSMKYKGIKYNDIKICILYTYIHTYI
jgi:hypothetical protein